MRYVLVTGVSSGIGHAAVGALLKRGYGVFGSVRRSEDAARLAGEFGREFTPLRFDVTREDEILAAADIVNDRVGAEGLWGLVNNAGIAVPGPLSALSESAFRRQFEVNVMGVFHVTRAFLPSLGMRRQVGQRSGRIINISSLSGRIAYPFMGAYAASKHALEALSDSWRRELMGYGIDVVVIEPGAIDTPVWDKASTVSSDFADSDYGSILRRLDLRRTRQVALPVERVSRVICEALECRRPRARYVIPDRWLTYWIIPRILPDRWLDRVIDRVLGLTKGSDARG